MVNEAIRAYSFAPASEPKLTNPADIQYDVRCLNVGKVKGPKSVPIRALKRLTPSVVSLLVILFNTIIRIQYFAPALKHARVFSSLKPGKDPALLSFYRPISQLDTVGKPLEKNLLIRILL